MASEEHRFKRSKEHRPSEQPFCTMTTACGQFSMEKRNKGQQDSKDPRQSPPKEKSRGYSARDPVIRLLLELSCTTLFLD